VARTLNSLALLKFAQGQSSQAAQLAQEAAAAAQGGNGSGNTAGAPAEGASDPQLELTRQLLGQGDFSAAEREARAALASPAARTAAQAQYRASAEYFLGEALLGQRRLAEAETVLRTAVDHWQQLDALGWRSALCRSALGEVLHLAGRGTEAEPLLLASYRSVGVDLGADQYIKRKIYQRLARFYNATGHRATLLALEISERQGRAQRVAQE
jgi:hypothetical protein